MLILNEQAKPAILFEGYYAGLATKIPLPNFNDLSLIKKDASLLYYRAKYVGFGIGMSIRGIDKQSLIAKVRNSKFKRLIISGWSFANFMKYEKNTAISTCEEMPTELQSSCLFSIGRAAFFRGLLINDIDFTNSKYFFAGYAFAHAFTNSEEILPMEKPGIKVGLSGAALYKEILGDDSKKSNSKSRQLQYCLQSEEKNAYDCFLQI